MAVTPGKMGKRVLVNRAALTELTLAVGDALFELAVSIVEEATPPDAPPYGVGLIDGGGAVLYAGTKKINGTQVRGKQVSKPRAVDLTRNGVTAIGGWGFPARFVEWGTLDTPSEPFLTPPFMAGKGRAEEAIRASLQAKGIGRRP